MTDQPCRSATAAEVQDQAGVALRHRSSQLSATRVEMTVLNKIRKTVILNVLHEYAVPVFATKITGFRSYLLARLQFGIVGNLRSIAAKRWLSR